MRRKGKGSQPNLLVGGAGRQKKPITGRLSGGMATKPSQSACGSPHWWAELIFGASPMSVKVHFDPCWAEPIERAPSGSGQRGCSNRDAAAVVERGGNSGMFVGGAGGGVAWGPTNEDRESGTREANERRGEAAAAACESAERVR